MEKEPGDTYKPLDSKKNEIRLLRLKPCQYNRDNNEDEQRIVCFLEHSNLENTIQYMALSYAWENGLESQEILVSGNVHSVSANLVDALRQLRQEFDELVLWADQLCINQDDHVEKASQIQIMRSIYEGATSVIAWIGVSANDSDLVFVTLDYINQYRGSSVEAGLLSEIARKMQTTSNSHEQVWNSGSVLDNMGAALSAFTARRYWTRLWVLQEFVVASNVLILCGSKFITYSTLRAAWKTLIEANDKHISFGQHKSSSMIEIIAILETWQCDSIWWDAWLRIDRFISQRDDYHSRHQHNHMTQYGMFMITYKTLSTFSGEMRMSCSDPRDQVFSLLGLASDSKEFGHFPDYTRCTERIYEELAQKFLQQGHVDVLSFCQENPTHRARNMASWAADWSLNIRIPIWGKLRINASQDWSADLATSVVDGRTIIISGMCIGTIRSHSCYWSQDKQLTLPQTQMFLNQIREFCNQSHLFEANEEEFVCAQLAAPTALAYLKKKELMLTEYQAVCKKLRDVAILPGVFKAELDAQFSSQYERELRRQLFKCPFITGNGHLGIAPPYIQEGDYLCIFPGGRAPYVLRKQLDSNSFTIVGAAYVYGIMNGEFFKIKRETRSFSLV